MKVVVLDYPQELIEERRHKGLDYLDEVWEGVYHLVPLPSGSQQDIVDELSARMGPYVQRQGLGVVRTLKAVCAWPDPERNYRVPDHVFVAADRSGIFIHDAPWLEEAPDVAIEVRSPGDETYEKLPFYESVGVREVLIIARDTRAVELLRRVGEKLVAVSTDREGWVRSDAMAVSFRRADDGALEVRLDLEDQVHRIVPGLKT